MNKGWYLVIAGAALGLADAYLSGSFQSFGFSPTTPNPSNVASSVNNVLPIPTSFILIGLGLYMVYA